MKLFRKVIIAIFVIAPAVCFAQKPKTDTTKKGGSESSQFNSQNYNIDRDYNSEPAKPAAPATGFKLSAEAQAAGVKNDFGPAISELSVFINASPNNVSALTNRANLYLKTRQADKALADAKAALLVNNKNYNAVFIAGSALILMRQPDLAIKYFDTALILKPDWLQALQYRGKLLVETRRNAEAIADLTRVIEMEPKNPTSFLLRARAYYRKYLMNESLMDYIAVTNMAPAGSKIFEIAKREFQLPLLEYEEREAALKEAGQKASAEVNSGRKIKAAYFDKVHPLNDEAVTLAMNVKVAQQSGYDSQLTSAKNALFANLNKQQELNNYTKKELTKIGSPGDKDILALIESSTEKNNKMIAYVRDMKVAYVDRSTPTRYYRELVDYDDYWD